MRVFHIHPTFCHSIRNKHQRLALHVNGEGSGHLEYREENEQHRYLCRRGSYIGKGGMPDRFIPFKPRVSSSTPSYLSTTSYVSTTSYQYTKSWESFVEIIANNRSDDGMKLETSIHNPSVNAMAGERQTFSSQHWSIYLIWWTIVFLAVKYIL